MSDNIRLDIRKTSLSNGLLKIVYTKTEGNNITITADVSDTIKEWCMEKLDYHPRLERDEHGDPQLEFRCEADAVLVRMTFAHMWSNE